MAPDSEDSSPAAGKMKALFSPLNRVNQIDNAVQQPFPTAYVARDTKIHVDDVEQS